MTICSVPSAIEVISSLQRFSLTHAMTLSNRTSKILGTASLLPNIKQLEYGICGRVTRGKQACY